MISRYKIFIYVFNSDIFLMQLDAAVREAFDVAYDNIYAFHFAQKSAEKSVENMKVSPYCSLLLPIYTEPLRIFNLLGCQM